MSSGNEGPDIDEEERDSEKPLAENSNFVRRLKKEFPTFYGILIAALGVAVLFSVHKNVLKSPQYEEMLAFVALCLFLYSVAMLVDFLFRQSSYRLIFAAIVVIVGLGAYSYEAARRTANLTQV